MIEKDIRQTEEVEVDLKRLLDAVREKGWVMLLAMTLCAAVTLLSTLFLVTPKYESAAMFYVNNSALSLGDASFSISSGDITASKNLVDSYIVILNTRSTLNDVIDYAGSSRSYSELKQMISAESVNDTEIFEVVVTSPDPEEAEQLANAIAYILPKRISGIIEGTSAKIVDSAVVASKHSSPSYLNNTVLGGLAGFMIALLVIVLQEMFNTSIRTEEDIMQATGYPVLSAVPDMMTPAKGAYYSAYNNKPNRKKTSGASKQEALLGGEMNFAASEAYKLLRTKLQYSFAGESASRVIGISSAMTGEGKSLTSVNLAYTLSQLGERVLLIDCDMRRPSISVKLPVEKKPGLSGYLSGQHGADALIQLCGLREEAEAFHVIASGQNPPNPVELLSSARMGQMLEQLRARYDYIILDLPPIGEVSDALTAAKVADGILLVARQEYCNRNLLSKAVRQFEFVGTRILGIVYNCASESGNGYGREYRKKYGSEYAKAQKAKNGRKV